MTTRAILILALFLTTFGCDRQASNPPLRVAAAASLKDVLNQLSTEYGRPVELTFGASGALASQIRQGAPIDVYLSADAANVDALVKSGDLLLDTRLTVAGNDLVLVVPSGAASTAGSFADLARPRFKRIAVGEPKTVPAGRYARQVLDRLKLTDKLQDKLVEAVDVRQVLAYVAAGEVDAGIVYGSDAAAAGGKVRVYAVADPSTHEPIRYDAAVVKASNREAAGGDFLAFLRSPKAQKAFADLGFSPPPRRGGA